MMPNAAETIERLAKTCERQRIFSMLQECKTLEEYEKVKSELKAQCNDCNK